MKIILIRVLFYLALLVYVSCTKKEVSKKDHQQGITLISSKDSSWEEIVASQESVVDSGIMIK